MNYVEDIRVASNAPERLERLYQTARDQNSVAEFKQDLLACYQASPDNVLYAAWYYRLQQELPAERHANWTLAIPLSLLTGFALWLLSDDRFTFGGPTPMPYMALLWAPVVALFTIAFLTFTARRGYGRADLMCGGLIGMTAYAALLARGRPHYRDLMALHLPLLAWAGVGISLVGVRSSPRYRFAFLAKSIEVMVTAGVYLIAVAIFAAITIGLFQALNLGLSPAIRRLLIAGVGGLIPLIAVANVYDPQSSPADQEFRQGLSRMVAILPRVLLPLTLVVLAAYLAVIPLNFMRPFESREVLIVYNAMLFAIMGLLVGVTPLNEGDLAARYHGALRSGILAVAILAVVVSLYALSATVYRTVLGGLTINRLTITGWNGINIGLLVMLIQRQFRHGQSEWIPSLHAVFSAAAVIYTAWATALLLATPWIF